MHDPTLLTAERLRALLHYDEATGKFTWIVYRGPWARAGQRAGSPNSDGYISIKIDGRLWKAHRLAWLYVTGEHPILHVDHIDGCVSNNAWMNLRQTDRCGNLQNQRHAQSSNTSGLLGAHYSKSKGRYQSEICAFGRRLRLGSFATAEEAHAAYVEAKRQLHPTSTI